MQNQFEVIIGLEVHAQLLTKSKIFCGCSAKYGSEPNSNVCPICLGHPGVLPSLNKKVVEYSVLMGLAVNCSINRRSQFARKHYFYPDLPKGYQITQFDEPICVNGYIEVSDGEDGKKKIRIKRIHMEEDAGKLIHTSGNETLIDFNRAGVPLIEIVTEPDLRSGKEAYEYLSKIKQIVQYLGICNGNMEEGSLRCDANISVRKCGDSEYGVKTELKNLNSFHNVQKAIEFEALRQQEMLTNGDQVVQETLYWDTELNKTVSMRKKEDSHDYRYFTEPDLFPVVISDEWMKEIAAALPELPEIKKERFVRQYSLPEYDAEILTQSKAIADYYESITSSTGEYKAASNWMMGEVLRVLNETGTEITEFVVPPDYITELINIISDGTINGRIAKEVFAIMIAERKSPAVIVKERNLSQISDTAVIDKIINEVLDEYPDELKEYISGKEKVLGFLIGQVMQKSQGKANPSVINKLIKDKILIQTERRN